ncbi:YfhO family protein [uncultured Draconibacterium sp.]|uniref:YfhO family protein n=1 Tax=uncultured Draconibacterium sp. TaxID=1573823 RepID=UPI0032172D2A
MKSLLKQALPHIISILAFVIVSSVYFHPAWEGKSLQGEDVVGSYGSNREIKDFAKYEEETVLWNGAIFSGMPNVIFSEFKGATALQKLYNFPRRMGFPHEISSLLWYMLGFYILLVSLGIKPLISAGGSIAFSLSSYYIIIILAGHYMKVDTLALIPPTLAGVFLCFNRKYLWGFILTAFFLAFQINMAHIQMIYYFMISLIILGIIEFYFHLKKKELKQFAITVAVLVGAALMGIAPNSAKLITYYKYNDYSIRGSSELTIGNEGVKTEKGLDKDYINAWSSGVDEAMMVIVPNVKGGSTGVIKQDRNLLNKVPRQYRETIGNMNQYWGNQPFSGGPNYLGIVFVFLFILGAFLIPGRFKLAALLPVILFFLLSMGGNLTFFTDLFIDYFPMYNKFRTPVSILAVAAIWVGLLAIFSLYQIYINPSLLEKKSRVPGLKKEQPVYLLVSAVFLLFLLINIAMPNLFNSYISDTEYNQFASIRNQQNVGSQLDTIVAALVDFRISVFRAELLRTLLFVAGITVLLFLYAKGKLKQNIFVAVIILLAVIDFWGTSRRYVPLSQFHKTGNAVKQAYLLTDIDRQIYQLEQNANPALPGKIEELKAQFKPATKEEEEHLITYATNKYNHYRVFNLTQSPFQENITTNAHSSIGGYHAVKLRRYQDMIEHHLTKMDMPVLNMLDTKYFITQNGLQRNPGAMGAAWFVDSVKWVDNANDEILALNDIDVTKTAVIRDENKDKITLNGSGKAEIELTEYSPDYLVYNTKTSADRLAVFSEVYFPDWEVYVDGKKSELFTANYILRSMMIPVGEHKIEFKFNPEYYYRSNSFAQLAYYLLLFVLVGAIAFEIYKNRNKLKEL